MHGIPITPDLQGQFEKVVRGLAAQGWRQSVLGPGSPACRYRGIDNRKCALGHLIPDAEYTAHLEGDISMLYDNGSAELLAVLPSQDVAAVWQGLHDDHVTPTSMRLAFCRHATEYGFTWPAEVA